MTKRLFSERVRGPIRIVAAIGGILALAVPLQAARRAQESKKPAAAQSATPAAAIATP